MARSLSKQALLKLKKKILRLIIFRTGEYICLNRGHLDSSEIFQKKIVTKRRNLNRLLSSMIINDQIHCRDNIYELKDLCHHVCTSSCEKNEVLPKPCYIEEISTTIDL